MSKSYSIRRVLDTHKFNDSLNFSVVLDGSRSTSTSTNSTSRSDKDFVDKPIFIVIIAVGGVGITIAFTVILITVICCIKSKNVKNKPGID